jgi:hypothetical protein
MGPMLIFDKSFLQSLNPDESVWLDMFFMSVITPLFFVETLADLEKEVARGRAPEQVVGSLAYKTPDLQSHVMPYHSGVLLSELLFGEELPMDGMKIMRSGGTVVELDGQKGTVYKMSQEEEAFNRWQRHEFLDLERQIAKRWRRSVSAVDYSESYATFKKLYGTIRRPKSLEDAKEIADRLIDLFEEEASMRFGMTLLNVSPAAQEDVVQRWTEAGKPPISEFAKYFRYLYSVELFYYLAIGADLISRVRPAMKADNKVDIAYLYYLPFCKIFVSSDNLHRRVTPLFLRTDQTFIEGPTLKADLGRLDEHYDELPPEIKGKGAFAFAAEPPLDNSFLVTQLWDRYFPNWRKKKDEKENLSPEAQKALLEMINRISEEAKPVQLSAPPRIEDMDYVTISRQILPKKGKWLRVPPESLRK